MLAGIYMILAFFGVTATQVSSSWLGGATKLEAPSYPADYGVDHSFPIHNYQKSNTIFKARYEAAMAGCYAKFSRGQCDANERARMEMNRDQPATQHNYTEIGFKKMKLPDHIWAPLLKFYTENVNAEKLEGWPPG